MKKLAFVTPRYGPDIVGGAETAARGLAEELVKQGWHVEVWTTCAKNHMTWENELAPGQTINNGVVVRRYPITLPIKSRENIFVPESSSLDIGEEISAHEYDWITYGPHCPEMYRHIGQHGPEFDVIVPIPYTIAAAHYAAWLYPERTIFWPCLHDEQYAYLEPSRLVLESVAGVIFNTPEEEELAVSRLHIEMRNRATLGCGVQPLAAQTINKQNQDIPHLLYVGRLEPAKNVPELYQFTQLYAERIGDIKLTVAGRGPSLPPPDIPYMNYCGFVTHEEKAKLYASSTAHWLPSVNESFSLVTLESWLAGRPTLVNQECGPPAGHVQRSKGGLAYGGFWEFAGAVQWLQENPELANQMGQNGKKYVERNYTWPVIAQRFEALVEQWLDA